MRGSAEKYEYLFTSPGGELSDQEIEELRHDHVARYRTKTIRAGEILECEIYPVWNCNSEIRKARAEAKKSSAAQRAVNDRNARRKLERKINANFGRGDISITLTYRGEVPDIEQARRDIRNYLRRVSRLRKRLGLPELKYIYVIEYDPGDGGRRKKRVHHHVIMSGMDRDKAEELWGKGYANADRLQPDQDHGLAALANYIVKDPRGAKRWCCSRNLVEPVITTADHKMGKRKAERLARDVEAEAREIFGRAHKGYRLVECEVKRSSIVAGVYIRAKMHRERGRHNE